VWQCGAVLLFEEPANHWLAHPRPWLGVVVANSMVMTFYLWNMSAVVLAAVLLFPTGIAPQPEPLSAAWWWLRPPWILACAICLIPFLLGFRFAERPWRGRAGRDDLAGVVVVLAGTVAAAAGFSILTTNAFPVPGESVVMPTVGVVFVLVALIVLRVNPLSRVNAR
jgi:hypothetical protein